MLTYLAQQFRLVSWLMTVDETKTKWKVCLKESPDYQLFAWQLLKKLLHSQFRPLVLQLWLGWRCVQLRVHQDSISQASLVDWYLRTQVILLWPLKPRFETYTCRTFYHLPTKGSNVTTKSKGGCHMCMNLFLFHYCSCNLFFCGSCHLLLHSC